MLTFHLSIPIAQPTDDASKQKTGLKGVKVDRHVSCCNQLVPFLKQASPNYCLRTYLGHLSPGTRQAHAGPPESFYVHKKSNTVCAELVYEEKGGVKSRVRACLKKAATTFFLFINTRALITVFLPVVFCSGMCNAIVQVHFIGLKRTNVKLAEHKVSGSFHALLQVNGLRR